MEGMRFCDYRDCSNGINLKCRYPDDKILFSIPKNEERRAKWLELAKIKLLDKKKRIFFCVNHFDEKFLKVSQRRTMLARDAVPFEYIAPNYIEIIPPQRDESSVQLKECLRFCDYPECSNYINLKSRTPEDKVLFSIPKKEKKRAKWLSLAKLNICDAEKRIFFCIDHFNKKYLKISRRRTVLSKKARPFEYMPDSNDEYESITSSSDELSPLSPDDTTTDLDQEYVYQQFDIYEEDYVYDEDDIHQQDGGQQQDIVQQQSDVHSPTPTMEKPQLTIKNVSDDEVFFITIERMENDTDPRPKISDEFVIVPPPVSSEKIPAVTINNNHLTTKKQQQQIFKAGEEEEYDEKENYDKEEEYDEKEEYDKEEEYEDEQEEVVTDPEEEVMDPEEEVTDPEEEVTDPEEVITDSEEEVTEPDEDVTNSEEEVTDPEEEELELELEEDELEHERREIEREMEVMKQEEVDNVIDGDVNDEEKYGFCVDFRLRDHSYCGESFIKQRSKEITRFVCPGCGQSFIKKYDINRHIKNVHIKNLMMHRNFICNEKDCGKAFSTNHRLIHHKKYSHRDLVPYVRKKYRKFGKPHISKFKVTSERIRLNQPQNFLE